MKAREARTSVILPARLRWDGRWVTATVRDISSRGLMLVAAAPPPPGTYVEIQIASSLIAARTVWVKHHQCGFQSRERLDVAALVGARRAGPPPEIDRRRAPRAPRQEPGVASRQIASLIQYSFAILVAVSAASSIAWEAHETLSAPVTAIEKQL